jgi:2,4-dienoyl-CoA reductase-like NADH-dependent reductase (Old Yellow Enzyme family)/thioredoxin reductase
MRKNELYPSLFKPLRVRNLTLKNRLAFAPMVCNLGTPEGYVTDSMVDFIGYQARTGVGYITIGDTQVDKASGAAFYGELDITEEASYPGMVRLAEEAKCHGARLSIELSHAGRGAKEYMTTKPAMAPSNIPVSGCASHLKVMDKDDMEYVKARFVECAKRCKKAGFEMVMIHCAHNNLLGQFLSPISNVRTDEYGGSPENRMRYPLEVLKAVRDGVGPDMVIEARVSAHEEAQGGLEFDESLEFMKATQEYADIIHISRGIIFTREATYTIPTYLQPPMLNVDYAAKAKKELHVPVAVVGNITTLDEAEEIIASGKADIVAMARAHMADPENMEKSVLGKSDDVRPCIRCDLCVSNAGLGLCIRCSVNPLLGREASVKLVRAERKKNVMVVGGGPAGMMAAQTLVKMGHDVTVYDRQAVLGGLLHDAAVPAFKGYLKKYVDWDIRTTMKSGAKIKLNTEVTPELIEQENPDALIIATGSSYIRPNIPGIDNENVKMVNDVEHHRVGVGGNVVVCGGGVTGVECSLGLAMEGRKVTVIDMLPANRLCRDMTFLCRVDLLKKVREYGVVLIGDRRISRFTDSGVEVVDGKGNISLIEGDTIVIALGVKSNSELAEIVRATYVLNVKMAGDVAGGKNIYDANHTGFFAALSI